MSEKTIKNYLSTFLSKVLCDIVIDYNFISVCNDNNTTNIFKINDNKLIFNNYKFLTYIGYSPPNDILYFMDSSKSCIYNYDIKANNTYITTFTNSDKIVTCYVQNDILYYFTSNFFFHIRDLRKDKLIESRNYKHIFAKLKGVNQINNFAVKNNYIYFIVFSYNYTNPLLIVIDLRTDKVIINVGCLYYMLNNDYIMCKYKNTIKIYKNFTLIKTLTTLQDLIKWKMHDNNLFLMLYDNEKICSEIIYNVNSEECYFNKQYFVGDKSLLLVYDAHISNTMYLECVNNEYISLITVNDKMCKKILPMSKEENIYLL